jgi:hypothetical protein
MTRKILGALPILLRDFVGLIGCAAMTYGAWQIYEPAGWMLGGMLLLVGAGALARAGA